MSEKVRVRFAPSPTGPLHIGGVRTALYNYLFAKKYNGDFILRVEDTDQNRMVEGAEQYIVDCLKWLGIEPNEGVSFGDGSYTPYRQSERKNSYRQYAEKLVEAGHAYYAFDSEAELEQSKAANPNAKYDAETREHFKNSLTLNKDEVTDLLKSDAHYVIRIKLRANEDVKFYDEIRGWVTVNTSQMDDKVLLKSDGMPTYHLANVCDDYVMKITHVIRGEEWLPSAPLHVLLYRYSGWENEMPKFAHLPLLLKPEGNGKLSKRDGDRLGFPVFLLEWTDPKTNEVSSGYKEKGYLPEAVLNMLAFLGWNPGGTQEIFSKEELVDLFTIEHIHKAGAKFDFEKAKWFNAEYIKRLDDKVLASLVKEDVEEKFGTVDTQYLCRACRLVKERLIFLNDITSAYGYLFKTPAEYEEAILFKVKNIKEILILDDFIQLIGTFYEKDEEIENKIKEFATTNAIKAGDLMKFIRVSLVGEFSGPAIPDLILLLGKEEAAKRIRNCYDQI
ncbi:MAG: glutamyl-tRNA synthetase [Bacteroidota bacterium]|nr:glutamyl-tRNA synthetase [Bacteroidota bacterium]